MTTGGGGASAQVHPTPPASDGTGGADDDPKEGCWSQTKDCFGVKEEYEIHNITKMGKPAIQKISSSKALWLFTTTNPIRRALIDYFVLREWFDYFILLTILANCVFLAMTETFEEAEVFFVVIFTLEMIIKVVGLGFIPYIKDNWNKLDFLVVILSYLVYIPQLGNYSAIKAFRVFRAFKSITAVPGLKLMVRALGNCVWKVMDPLLLILFTAVLFAIFGVQMYAGKLRQTCVCVPDYTADPLVHGFASEENMTATWNADEENWEPNYVHCSLVAAGRQCPATSDHCASRAVANRWDNVTVSCLPVGHNPAYGYISFDHFGWAMLTAFQLLTADWWEGVYGPVMMSTTEASVVYFLFVIFLGSFFVLNLVLAVVEGAFEQTKDAEEHEHEAEELVAEAAEACKEGEAAIAAELAQEAADGGGAAEVAPNPGGLEDGSGEGNADPKDVLPQWRKKMQWFLETNAFVGFVVALIVGNTLTMALWNPDIKDTKMDSILEIFNHLFTGCFILEMILKMVGYGFVSYFVDKPGPDDSSNRSSPMWNRFDCFVVTVSIIEIIILASGVEEVGGLSILRTFRLLRVLKLGQNWKTMNKLISTLYDSFDELGYLTLIMVIVLYTFAALGMQLFMEDYQDLPLEDVPLWNFTDFWHSLMMVFRVLCGEWIEPLHDSLNLSSWPIAIIFFLITLFVGNFIMINLFLSLLLGAFNKQQEIDAENENQSDVPLEDPKPDPASFGSKIRRFFGWRASPPGLQGEQREEEQEEEGKKQAAEAAATSDSTSTATKDGKVQAATTPKALPNLRAESRSAAKDDDAKSRALIAAALPGTAAHKPSTGCCPTFLAKQDEAERNMGNLCCCLPDTVDNSLWRPRRFISRVVLSPYFESVILVLILWSSLMLCWEDVHFNTNKELFDIIAVFNIIFIVAFTTEATLKIVGFGWYGYFSDGWNCLDFTIVIIGLLSLTLTGGNIKALKALRTLRALRPLRAIRKWEGMKIVVDSMLGSIPAIFNVMIVTFLIFLIFGIVGVQFFGGTFGACRDADGERLDYLLYPNKTVCDLDATVEWVVPDVNFDRIDKAIMALFQVGTFEGWMAVMENGVDSVGFELQPRREASYAYMIYFFIFIVMGSFFTLNLFIGVIIDNFQDRRRLSLKEGKNHGLFVTKTQQAYLDKLRASLSKKPQKKEFPPTNPFRKLMFTVSNALWFDICIMGVIGINTVFFALAHYGQSDEFSKVLWIGNAVFTFIYVLEALIKIIGFGRGYIVSKVGVEAWNVFDFTIMALSVVSVVIDMSTDSVTPWLATAGGAAAGVVKVLRILRVFRVIRFLRYAGALRRLVMTLLVSLPALVNIFVVYLLTVFIYSVIAMNLFKDVQQDPGGSINDYENFSTFKKSLLLLFRLSTSAGWDEVTDACSIAAPQCNETLYLNNDGEYIGDCGNKTAAHWFFASLVVVVFLVVISAYIAVILDNLGEEEDEDTLEVTPEVIQEFYEVWKVFDPDATSLLSHAHLKGFLEKLPLPLGYPHGVSEKQIADLEIPCYKSSITAAFLTLTHSLYDDKSSAASSANSATRAVSVEKTRSSESGASALLSKKNSKAGGNNTVQHGVSSLSIKEEEDSVLPPKRGTEPARSLSDVTAGGDANGGGGGGGGSNSSGDTAIKKRPSLLGKGWDKLRSLANNSVAPAEGDSAASDGGDNDTGSGSVGAGGAGGGASSGRPASQGGEGPAAKPRIGRRLSLARRGSQSVMLNALSPSDPKLHCADVLNHLIRTKTMLNRDRDARSVKSIESTLQLGRVAIFQKFPDYKHLGAPATDTRKLYSAAATAKTKEEAKAEAEPEFKSRAKSKLAVRDMRAAGEVPAGAAAAVAESGV